jgi:hypothetical protein
LGCWPSRSTFIVELPHISMQLVTADMTIEETVDAIDHMLRAHQVIIIIIRTIIICCATSLVRT